MGEFGRRAFLAGAAATTAGITAAGRASAATTTAGTALTKHDLGVVLASLGEHFAQRASLATKHPIRVSSDSRIAASYRRSYADQQSAIAKHALAIAGTHSGYVHAASRARPVSSRQAADGSIRLTVQEITALAFAKVVDAGNDDMSYEAEHVVTLTRSGGAWTIRDIEFRPQYRAFIPITQLPGDVPAGTPDHPIGAPSAFTPARLPSPREQGPQVKKGTASRAAVRASAIASRQALAGYDYAAMVSYAARWYNGFNSNYPKYGDDCTNFVSQCLNNGGWRIVDGGVVQHTDDHYWFYHLHILPNSYSWGGSQNLRNFAYLSGRAYDLDSPWHCGPGDLLGYDFNRDGTLDHMQMACTNNSGNPLMTQHSPGYYRKPLTEILAGHNWRLWPQRT